MSVPIRMCVSCRKRNQKDELIRISNQNGQPIVDNKKEQTSRAIYVCKDKQCVEILKKSKAIQRLLNVQATEDFYENLKNLI